MVYANTIFDGDMVELTEEERGLRMQAFVFNVGRLLDIEEGNLMYFMQMFGDGIGDSNK